MLIGYFYSINFKPVLQNNVLFFSFPLLIISIGNLLNGFKSNIYIAFMCIFTAVGVFQIFVVKQRYSFEINDVYASQISTLTKEYNSQSAFLIDGPVDVFEYHKTNTNKSLNLNTTDNIWMMSQNKWNWHDLYLSLKNMKGKNDLWFMSNAGTNPVIRTLLYYYFENGTTYSGDWLENKRTGKGVLTYLNGDKYEGDFLENKRHGMGILTEADGGTKSG
jgi:hypothetical protein